MIRHAEREIIYNLTMYKLPFTQAYVWTEKNACINARRYMYVLARLHVCNGKSTCTYAMKWGIFYNETKSKQLLKVHKSVGIGRTWRILNFELWILNCLRMRTFLNMNDHELPVNFHECFLSTDGTDDTEFCKELCSCWPPECLLRAHELARIITNGFSHANLKPQITQITRIILSTDFTDYTDFASRYALAASGWGLLPTHYDCITLYQASFASKSCIIRRIVCNRLGNSFFTTSNTTSASNSK